MKILDLLDYADLPVGETQAGACPECGKHKFYVTRKPTGYAYICFRATCSLAPGYIGYSGGMYVSPSDQPIQKRKRPVFTGKTTFLSESDQQFLADRFNMVIRDEDWRVTSDDEYAMPIRNARQEQIGTVVRQPTWIGSPRNGVAGAPKARTYLDEGEPKLAWYKQPGTDTCVIVEDQISAMRIRDACSFTSVALLGTTLSAEQAGHLAREKYSRYILALDPDATHKALAIARRVNGLFPNGLRVVFLDSDPKDYTDDSDLLSDLT